MGDARKGGKAVVLQAGSNGPLQEAHAALDSALDNAPQRLVAPRSTAPLPGRSMQL